MEEPNRLEEAAGVEPKGEAAGAVVAAVDGAAAPKGEPDDDPNTDVEDGCGAAAVGVDDPKIDDPEGWKTEEEAFDEPPKGEEAACCAGAPKLLLAPNTEDPCEG